MKSFFLKSSFIILTTAFAVNASEPNQAANDAESVQDSRFTNDEAMSGGNIFSKLMERTPAGFSLNSWMSIGNGALADASGANGVTDDGTVGVNQLGLSMNKTGEKVSYHMDVLYGRDAGYFQGHHNDGNNWDNSAGFDSGDKYGVALPQFYMTTNYGDTTLKLGHFLADSHTGHYSSDRFFATRTGAEVSLSPYTLNGVVAHRTIGEVDYHIGWSSGINVAFNTMAGSGTGTNNDNRTVGGDTLIFGAKTDISDKTSLRYNGYRGSLSGFNAFNNTVINDAYSHDLTLSHEMNDKLTLNFYYGTKTGADLHAFRQSAFYQLNDRIAIGQRYEDVRGGVTGSTHTVGMNIKSSKFDNLTLRPEIRYSKVGSADTTSFFMDAVLTY
ncbi:MAG: hypothetical protein CMM02_03455 [Rhodopirellula sp.]|nr:hypothetical protein [Rhodopirellula sp.]